MAVVELEMGVQCGEEEMEVEEAVVEGEMGVWTWELHPCFEKRMVVVDEKTYVLVSVVQDRRLQLYQLHDKEVPVVMFDPCQQWW